MPGLPNGARPICSTCAAIWRNRRRRWRGKTRLWPILRRYWRSRRHSCRGPRRGRATSRALGSLRLEHEANLATMRATAARLADREEALERRRTAGSRIAAPARAADRDVAGRGTPADRKDRADRRGGSRRAARSRRRARARRKPHQRDRRLRRLSAGARAGRRVTTERDENAVLRQTINEIGAAIIRTATLSLSKAPRRQDRSRSLGKGAEDADAPARGEAAKSKATSK